MTVQTGRYVKKPVARLLECYVLWAIDALHPEEEVQLDGLAPKLAELYDLQGTWHQIVAAVLDLPSNMRALVRGYWESCASLAQERGASLAPHWFAETFVDAHLS